MLYDIEKKKVHSPIDCFTCPHYDSRLLKCHGANKCCFEYDEKTKTVIDGVTKLPLKVGNNG